MIEALLKALAPLAVDALRSYLKTEGGQRHARELRDAFLAASIPGAPAEPVRADGTPVVATMTPLPQPGPTSETYQP